MAPEQFAGKKVDARADQWSFSVMLYEALHGTRPYVANSLGELAKKVQEGTVEVSDALPVEVRRTLLRGLQRDPAARFASMDELLATLTKDTRAARRRTLSWLGVGALAVVAVVAGYKPQRGAVAPCSGAERKLAGVWDAQQRGEMRAAFLRTARPFAQKAWTESERSLSVYAAGFVRSHTEVCEATRLRAEQSEQLMDLRLGCLELRRKDLAAVRDVFLHADGQVVEGAQRIVAAMPSLDSCSNTQELLTAPPPTDPMLRARMADLETALAQIRVRSNAGQYQQGLEHMNVRLPQVLELGQRRLSAEYQRTLGRLLEGSSRYGDAEKSYYDALFDAEAAHSDTLAAEIRLRILWLIRMWRPQDPHLALLGRETVAAVARAGDPPTLLAAYYDVEGIGHDMLGDNAAARSSMERALALYERARGLESLEAANTLNNLAYVYHKLGRWDDALGGLRRALTIADKLVGPAHPFSAKIRHHIGTNLSLMGRPAEALPMLQAAVKVHESSDSAPNEQTARLLGSLGITFALLGRYDEARNLILRELQIADSLLGKEHPANGAARRNLAEVLERQGRLVEAGARFEEALRISQKAYGAEHTDVALAYVGLARIKGESGHAAAALSDYRQAQAIFVRLQKQPDQDAIEAQLGVGASLATLNRHAEALPILESALAAMPTSQTPLNDRLRGRILSALARVLWAMSRPGDQGRAMEHAQSARRLLTPLPMAKAELTLVQTWLALRGQP